MDDQAVIEVFVDAVGSSDWSRRMAETWQQAGTLRVLRREPYATSAGKILPLHVLGPAPILASASRPSAAGPRDR